MQSKLLSVLGILIAVSLLGAATIYYPGGFDWNRDYISTLLRGPTGLARSLADAGVLLFCVSLASAFWRLAQASEFAKQSKGIRIGGVGSMVYASLTITPMHDLMVTISLVFLLFALVQLIRALRSHSEVGFFVAGIVCLVVLAASAAIYYLGFFVSLLPWAQRLSFGLLSVWLLVLDFRFHSAVRGN